MAPPDDIQSIPNAKVAVQVDQNTGLRQLRREEAILTDKVGSFEWKMQIVNALEIQIASADSDEEETNDIEYTYDLVSYSTDALMLQFNFANPAEVSSTLTDPKEISVTFWGTEFFKNTRDKEVPLGSSVT